MARAAKKTKAAEVAEEVPTPAPKLITYKGFDAQMRCRGFRYEVGGHYVHTGPVKACLGGFHSCEHPLSVFNYYPPAGSRFAEVEVSGEISRDGSDTKIASAEITIKAELNIGELVARTWEWVWSRAKLEDGAPRLPPALGAPRLPPAIRAPRPPPATRAPRLPPAVRAPRLPPAVRAPRLPPANTLSLAPSALRAKRRPPLAVRLFS